MVIPWKCCEKLQGLFGNKCECLVCRSKDGATHKMRMPGVESGSQAGETCMMPLLYMCHAFFHTLLCGSECNLLKITPPAQATTHPAQTHPPIHRPPRPANHTPHTHAICRGYTRTLGQAPMGAARRLRGGQQVSKQGPDEGVTLPILHRHCVRAVKEMDPKSVLASCDQGYPCLFRPEIAHPTHKHQRYRPRPHTSDTPPAPSFYTPHMHVR